MSQKASRSPVFDKLVAAVRKGDAAARAVLRDWLEETDPVAGPKLPPALWVECSLCDHIDAENKRRDSNTIAMLRDDNGRKSPLAAKWTDDANLYVYCHWCGATYSRYRDTDILRAAGVWRDDGCIRVWPFKQVPTLLQLLSRHGGDEDWLALLPPSAMKEYGTPNWMESGSAFGCCDVSRLDLSNGWTVAIGAHA